MNLLVIRKSRFPRLSCACVLAILSMTARPASAFEMDFLYATKDDYIDSIGKLRRLAGGVPGADVFTYRENRESQAVSLPILTPTYNLQDSRRYAASNYSVLRFVAEQGEVQVIIENSSMYIYGYVSAGVFYYIEAESESIQLPEGVLAGRRVRLSGNANYASLTSEINRLRRGGSRFSRERDIYGVGGQILSAHSFRSTINNLASFGGTGRVTRVDALEGIVFLTSAVAEAARFRVISARIGSNYDAEGYVLSDELIALINDWSDAGAFLQEHSADRGSAMIAKKSLTYAQIVGIMGLLYYSRSAHGSNEIRRSVRSVGDRFAVDRPPRFVRMRDDTFLSAKYFSVLLN